MRKLASIQEIVKLEPIEKADAIEKATVLGWELVVKKGDFNVGDPCVYVEIDSILPKKPEFEFLKDRKYRIRTIKLRGQVSQGIAFPISILPHNRFKIGDDVTEVIGVKKYDPQAELERKESERIANIHKNRIDRFLKRYSWYRKLWMKQKRSFPAFIKKTDEDRIQLFPHIYEQGQGKLFNVSEKLDGQSATYFILKQKGWFKKDIFGVCSRNIYLSKKDSSNYWKIADQYDIKKLLSAVKFEKFIYIQGEIIGRGIQSNKYELDGLDFYAFNLNIDGTHMNVYDNCFGMKIKAVPFLASMYILPIPEMVEFSKGESQLHNTEREGIVVRNNEGFSCKVINPDFLLKHGE